MYWWAIIIKQRYWQGWNKFFSNFASNLNISQNNQLDSTSRKINDQPLKLLLIILIDFSLVEKKFFWSRLGCCNQINQRKIPKSLLNYVRIMQIWNTSMDLERYSMTSNVIYLGLRLDSNLTFGANINNICQMAGFELNASGGTLSCKDFKKKRLFLTALFMSQFHYFQLDYTFHNRAKVDKMNSPHERRHLFNI